MLVSGAVFILAWCPASDGDDEAGQPAATTTAPSPTTTATMTPTTTSALPPARRCVGADLEVRYEDRDQAMNQPSYFFSVTNTAGPCIVSGYPQVELLDGGGEPIRLRQGRGGGFVSNDPGPRDITVMRLDKAWFTVSSVTVCGGEPAEAPMSAATSVTLPGATTATTVSAGLPYCPGGHITVSALTGEKEDLYR